MHQHHTHMLQSSYYAYCHAWVVCFARDRADTDCLLMDIQSANDAVRAGIVFG